MLINLWVKDKSDGYIHQVGTDVHDSIEFLGGAVTYVNMQSMGGTPDDYEFVEAPDIDDYISVTPEQLYLNRELVHKDIIEKCTKVMTMKNFTIENKDDINSAIDGLGQFCHSFCMNCEETEKTNDLVFRCEECPFEDKETRKCRVKIFLNKYGTPEQIDRATCMGSL